MINNIGIYLIQKKLYSVSFKNIQRMNRAFFADFFIFKAGRMNIPAGIGKFLYKITADEACSAYNKSFHLRFSFQFQRFSDKIPYNFLITFFSLNSVITLSAAAFPKLSRIFSSAARVFIASARAFASDGGTVSPVFP